MSIVCYARRWGETGGSAGGVQAYLCMGYAKHRACQTKLGWV